MEKIIEEMGNKSSSCSSEVQTDGTDVANLEAILEIQRESNRYARYEQLTYKIENDYSNN